MCPDDDSRHHASASQARAVLRPHAPPTHACPAPASLRPLGVRRAPAAWAQSRLQAAVARGASAAFAGSRIQTPAGDDQDEGAARPCGRPRCASYPRRPGLERIKERPRRPAREGTRRPAPRWALTDEPWGRREVTIGAMRRCRMWSSGVLAAARAGIDEDAGWRRAGSLICRDRLCRARAAACTVTMCRARGAARAGGVYKSRNTHTFVAAQTVQVSYQQSKRPLMGAACVRRTGRERNRPGLPAPARAVGSHSTKAGEAE